MRNTVMGQRYRILDRLGEGGMANVYRALDEKLGRYVAVKILHEHLQKNPDIRSRFQQEAQAVSTLDHPNIVRIYDFSGPDNEQLWLVAELINGTTLSKVQESRVNGRLPEIAAACVVREITRALEHAHKCGIVHRDIKPENVMITADGRLKLMDFGIAKDTHNHRKTQTGMFMGSPSYMSPEQIRGRNVDGRSDICSLGVVFYELLTSRLPFEGENSAAVIEKITRGEFVFPRFRTHGLSLEIDRIVVRCMQKQPETRYQTAAELGAEIDQWLLQQRVFSSTQELEQFILTGVSGQPKTLPEASGAEFSRSPELAMPPAATDVRDRNWQAPPPIATKVRTAKPRRLTPETKRLADNSGFNDDPETNRTLPLKRDSKEPNIDMRSSQKQARRSREEQKHHRHQRRQRPDSGAGPDPRRAVRRIPAYGRPVYKVGRDHRASQLPILLSIILAVVMGLLWATDFKPMGEAKRIRSTLGAQANKLFSGIMEIRDGKRDLNGGPTRAPDAKPQGERSIAPDPLAVRGSENSDPERDSKTNNEATNQTTVPPSRNSSKRNEKPRNPATGFTNKRNKVTPPKDLAVVIPQGQTTPPRKQKPETVDNRSTGPVATPVAPTTPRTGTPAATGGQGRISIASSPAAEIFIDDKRIGTTVDTGGSSGWLLVDAGKIKITLKRPGYKDYTRKITLRNNQRLALRNIELTVAKESTSPGKRTGVTIITNKWPADVSIIPRDNSSEKPKKFLLRGRARTVSLTPGQYQVRIEADGEVRERRIDTTISTEGVTYQVEFENLRPTKGQNPARGGKQP